MARVEEPEFSREEKEGDVEVRHYEPMVVASTTIEGTYREALNEGFRRLAGYIFGGNTPRERIAMTAPVSAREEGERLEMTAPVEAQKRGDRWTVSFVMPSGRDLEDLPRPLDERVQLHALGERRVAVLRFRGWATERSVRKHTSELIDWLVEKGLAPSGEPTIAQYNPPWTPPFLRRNEIWIELT